jgi:hypothetical protein
LIGCSQRSPFWARSSTRSRESGASSTTTLFQNGRSDRTQGNPANRVPASHTTYPTQQSSSCQSNPPPERFIAIAYTRDMTRLADTNQHRKEESTPWNNIASTNTHSQVESTKYTTFHGSAPTYRTRRIGSTSGATKTVPLRCRTAACRAAPASGERGSLQGRLWPSSLPRPRPVRTREGAPITLAG